jgi:hypothetical protein
MRIPVGALSLGDPMQKVVRVADLKGADGRVKGLRKHRSSLDTNSTYITCSTHQTSAKIYFRGHEAQQHLPSWP